MLIPSFCPLAHSPVLSFSTHLRSNGAKDAIDRCFPGMEVAKEQDFDITLQLDCDRVTQDKVKLISDLCELKKVVCGGPIEKALTSLLKKEAPGPVLQINYRKNESMFICPSSGKVVIVFMVDFADQTDKAMAKVFLQEFVEAQRTVRTAPPVQYLREAPGELSALNLKYSPDIAGFISFALEERHVQGARLNTAVTLLTGFRSYLLYHIKCSKTYLHMRMRKRVAGWMQVLNRALPEVETEKKTAAGKTFTRK